MDKVIEKISSKKNDYLIKRIESAPFGCFYVEVKTRNKFKLYKEYYDDYVGNTYKHPIFLNKFYLDNIDSAKNLINIQINFDNNEI